MKHLSNIQKRIFFIITLVLLVAMLITPAALAKSSKGKPTPVRFATFNASLNRGSAGQLGAEPVSYTHLTLPTTPYV